MRNGVGGDETWRWETSGLREIEKAKIRTWNTDFVSIRGLFLSPFHWTPQNDSKFF